MCASWGSLGGPLRALLGRLRSLLGRLRRLVSRPKPLEADLGATRDVVGRLDGCLIALGGDFGPPKSRPGALLRASWTLLGRFWKAAWVVLDAVKKNEYATIARFPNGFGRFVPLGPSWGSSWSPLGASRRPLGPFETSREQFETPRGHLGVDPGTSWTALAAV